MGQHISKHPKLEKICVQCGRKMTWRKSWAKNWHEVKYCSNACKKKKSNKVGQIYVQANRGYR